MRPGNICLRTLCDCAIWTLPFRDDNLWYLHPRCSHKICREACCALVCKNNSLAVENCCCCLRIFVISCVKLCTYRQVSQITMLGLSYSHRFVTQLSTCIWEVVGSSLAGWVSRKIRLFKGTSCGCGNCVFIQGFVSSFVVLFNDIFSRIKCVHIMSRWRTHYFI